MARPKKVIEPVEVQDVREEEIKETTKEKVTTVAMVRDESYPEPRSADVHPDEVENWKQFGWTKK